MIECVWWVHLSTRWLTHVVITDTIPFGPLLHAVGEETQQSTEPEEGREPAEHLQEKLYYLRRLSWRSEDVGAVSLQCFGCLSFCQSILHVAAVTVQEFGDAHLVFILQGGEGAERGWGQEGGGARKGWGQERRRGREKGRGQEGEGIAPQVLHTLRTPKHVHRVGSKHVLSIPAAGR